jgi:hypothetical protein
MRNRENPIRKPIPLLSKKYAQIRPEAADKASV